VALNLLRENEIVSKMDIIPGLQVGPKGFVDLDEPYLDPVHCVVVTNLNVNISERFETQLFSILEANHKQEFSKPIKISANISRYA
jgi:hypothetical protein